MKTTGAYAVLLFLLCGAAAARAADTRTYTGIVTDSKGKPLAGVGVWSVINEGHPIKQKEAETTTDAKGRYTLGPLRAIEPIDPFGRARRARMERILRFDHPD